MNRTLAVALAAALAAPMSVAASSINLEAKCHVESGYSIDVDSGRVGFTRKSSDTAGPARIQFSRDGLLIDGQRVELTAADVARVQQFNSDILAMVPQVKQIASDSIDIAFIALSSVVTQFSSEARRAELLSELKSLQVDAMRAVAAAKSSDALESQAFEARVEAAVKRIVPTLAGEFAAQAISVALSGDADAAATIERRANEFGAEIERSVEGAAKSLEAKVAKLCPQVAALDTIDNSFEWRLPDGSKPALLEYSVSAAEDEAK